MSAESLQYRIAYITAPSGSGKSYSRVRYGVDVILCETDWHWITNLPVDVDAIAEFVAGKLGCEPGEVAKRIEVLPREVTREWAAGRSGPWEYFAEPGSLEDCYLQLDEVHNYCGSNHSRNERKKWQLWLGELRHAGCRGIELISQNPEKVAKEVRLEATESISLVRSDTKRDPFFGILLGDWYEMRAAFLTRAYEFAVWEIQKRAVDGRQVREHCRKWRVEPDYFRFYDSHNAAQSSGHDESGSAGKYEFERRSRWGLLWWFLKRNGVKLVTRGAVGAFVLFLCMGGGGPLMMLILGWFTSVSTPEPLASPDTMRGASVSRVTYTEEELQRLAPGTRSALVKSEDVAEKVARLESELEAARSLYAALLERVERTFVVAALTDKGVVFRNGESYAQGEKIEWGPYEGQTIEHINFGRRYVRLDSGVTLRMGVSREREAQLVGSGLPAALRGGEGSGGGGGNGSGGSGAAFDGGDERNAVGGVSAVGHERSGALGPEDIRRSRIRARHEARNGGAPRATPLGSS